MAFLDVDDGGEWQVICAPRGVDSSGAVFFLRGYDAAGEPYWYTGTRHNLAIAWADHRLAEAMQMIEGGEIVAVTLAQAISSAVEARAAFILRVEGHDYLFDLRGRAKAGGLEQAKDGGGN